MSPLYLYVINIVFLNKKPTSHWWIYHFAIPIDNPYIKIVVLRNRK